MISHSPVGEGNEKTSKRIPKYMITNKAITNNVVPKFQVRTTDSSFVLHIGKPNDAALAICESSGMKSAGCSKAICRWSNSGHANRRAMIAALDRAATPIIAMHEMHDMITKMTEEEIQVQVPPVFRNICIKSMLQTCGVWGINSKDKILNTLQACDTVSDCADLTVRLTKAMSYIHALERHDALNGLNKGELEQMPSLSDLDEYLAAIGIGDPDLYGSVAFFGFDGDVESLANCNGKHKRDLTPVMMACAVGSDVHGDHLTTLMLGYDDALHQNWRNLQWQLDDSRFDSNSVESDPLVDAMPNENTKKYWSGIACYYLESEGMGSSVKPMGVIYFDEEADKWMEDIARTTKIYDVDAEGHDVIWTRAVANMTQTMIGLFGVTGYSMLETFVIGYYINPSICYVVDLNRENIESAMTYMPFVVDPMFNADMIEKIKTDKAQRSAFVEAHRRMHCDDLDHAVLEKHLDIALGKLDVLLQQSVKTERDLSDKTSLLMDNYAKEATLDFVEILNQMMDLDKQTKTSDREK